MSNTKLWLTFIFLCFFSFCFGQSPFAKYDNLFTAPSSYVVAHTAQSPVIDGDINDDVWSAASWTSSFQDIEGGSKAKPYYNTRAKMLWDDAYLYIAAEIQDPHVWGTLTKRDEIVFFDNDFEIFIDPANTAHNYFEIEINALNNIFDLFLYKPYRSGGSALFSWDSQGMKHAVKIQGTLNNPNDEDRGWTVEFAIPFRALTMGNNVHVPKDKDVWRINFSRVQWETQIVDGKYVKQKDTNGKVLPENNWVWSPQGVIDMHRPERWGYLAFSKNSVGGELPQFQLPYTEKQKNYLWLIYYLQQDFRSKHKKYATSLKELGVDDVKIKIDNKQNTLSLFSTGRRFEIVIEDRLGQPLAVNEEGLIIK